ncbi:hypothetical protein [Comamonas thiooxydans]|uniref:hypothetical protein n=2 Tax=Comamonas thiooxydans TaxID=363952 RepID=UPI000F4DCDF2|nr:hypothetical protein [Comamonas thiooxydans]MDO1476496.1 hypothetical protein [Comamonas thiooxydans]
MKALVLAAVTAALAMSYATQSVAQSAPKPAVTWTKDVATEAEIDDAKKTVISQLKDPESARFGEIFALSGTNGKRSVCGYINAKNSYGGYTGDKMFSIISSGSVVIQGSGPLGGLLPGICLPRTVQ